jgi:membrane-associated phospholipid phosphatase
MAASLTQNSSGRRRANSYWWLAIALGISALGVLAMPIDLPVANWCLGNHCPAAIKKLLALAEVFGHGFGVVAILLSVAVLDPVRRWTIPRLVICSLGAGLLANVGKLILGRVRPHHFDFTGGVRATFLKWFPWGTGESLQQGFPSSHTATAVGLAIALAWIYPRGRWLFAMFAVLVALQRIESGAHFVSDTLWGAAVGIAVGGWFASDCSLGWLGNRLERRLSREAEGTVERKIQRTAA